MKTALLSLIVLCGSAFSATHRYEFTQAFEPKGTETSQPKTEIWVPLPLEESGYQKVLSRQWSGNATSVKMAFQGRVPYLHVKWEGVDTAKFEMTQQVEIWDRRGGLSPQSGEATELFLQGTGLVPVDGPAKALAQKITRGKTGAEAKARAIYDWMVANTSRDPKVKGCGVGNVKAMLESGQFSGKCADLNSLFVSLVRASGVPAREVFGQRLGASAISPTLSAKEDNSKAQHCRAEFYSPKAKAWIPADPADVRKVILEEKMDEKSPRVKVVADALFGQWEGNWVAYNFGRDLTLADYSREPVNYFMYPLLLAGEFRPSGTVPEETGYRFSVKTLP